MNEADKRLKQQFYNDVEKEIEFNIKKINQLEKQAQSLKGELEDDSLRGYERRNKVEWLNIIQQDINDYKNEIDYYEDKRIKTHR